MKMAARDIEAIAKAAGLHVTSARSAWANTDHHSAAFARPNDQGEAR